MPNRVVHFEIHADNPERCADFYKKIFGWDIKKWEGGMEYWVVMTGARDEAGGINGGIVRRPGQPAVGNEAITGYVCTMEVSSFDEYAAKILANGGKEAMPKFAIKGMAWQGYFKDTEGNCFGLHQLDKNAA